MYYEVKGTNLRIAGSMHIFPADSPHVPDWLWEAYKWCEHLVIESDPKGIIQYRSLQAGVSLSSIIPDRILDAVSRHWPTDGSFADMHSLKPWAVLFALPSKFLPLVAGVELQLLERVAAEHKTESTLESSESLARLLDAVPTDVYSSALDFIVSNPDFIRSNILALHRAWISCDLSAVMSIVEQSPIWHFKILRETFVDARNRAWMPTIRSNIQSKQRTLVVIGALHLCGERSVTKLCEKEDGHILSNLL